MRLRNEKGVVLELRGAKLGVEVSANLAIITITMKCCRSRAGHSPTQGDRMKRDMSATGTSLARRSEAPVRSEGEDAAGLQLQADIVQNDIDPSDEIGCVGPHGNGDVVLLLAN